MNSVFGRCVGVVTLLAALCFFVLQLDIVGFLKFSTQPTESSWHYSFDFYQLVVPDIDVF